MDEGIKGIFVIGASAAANCHPCLDHQFAKSDVPGIDREEDFAAVTVGMKTNRGARKTIREKARELLGETAVGA